MEYLKFNDSNQIHFIVWEVPLELIDELMKFPEEIFNHSKIYFVTSSLDQRDKLKSLNYPIIKGFKEKTITTELLKDMQ